MKRHKTSEQVRAEHFDTLGPILGPLYHALYNEVVRLDAKWQQYRILFATSPERLELISRVAGNFFRLIRGVLWQDIMLHLARLIDPPQSPGKDKKDNLTLMRLADTMPTPALSLEIQSLVGEARKTAEFARDWRNRRLAHTDLNLALNEDAVPLPEVSRAAMERALAAVRAVLNRIERHFWQSETLFTHFIAHGDAESLVHYLKVAVDMEDREHIQWLSASRQKRSK